MAINHGSLSAELTPRGVVGGRVQNSVIAYENDYERLINKPSVNNVELDGDLSLEDLGIVNNVQPDWEQDDTEAEDYIKNKPYIPKNLSDLNDDSDHRTVTDAEKTTWDNKSDFSGSYNDLTDKPVIPDAQIQSDWNQSDNTKADFIKNKPSIPSAQVQSDWNESDSSKADYIKNKPTIPAEQVNSDWNAESGKAQILNKPSIPTALADLTDDSTHRTVTDTEKTAWNSGEANVQSNWNETDTTSDAYIQNKPSIPSVTANPGSTTATLSSIGIDGTNYAISGGSGGGAVDSVNGKTGDVVLDAEDVGALPDDTPLFSGNYNDLSNKPTIPTVNNSTITIQKNGQNVDTFTLNQATNKAIDIPVPTKTSDITNDSSFITNTVNNLANYYLKSETYTKTEVGNLLDSKVDKVSGKGLSTNDYSNTDKAIVDGVTSALANKADKVSSPTSGNLAGLDVNGNLTDAGWASDKTTTSRTGNPISISGLKSNQLAKNPIITFEPIQAGSGDPSPSNVRAITGYDKIEVLSCGKNVWNSNKAPDVTGTYWGWFINYSNSITVRLIDKQNGADVSECYIGLTGNGINADAGVDWNLIKGSLANEVLTVSVEHYISIYPNTQQTLDKILARYNIMVVVDGAESLPYEPYNPITNIQLTLGQTIYGGTLDVEKGILTVNRGIDNLANHTWQEYNGRHYTMDLNSLCPQFSEIIAERYKRASEFSTMTENSIVMQDNLYVLSSESPTGKLVYPLATPYTIQLTPHEISLLKDYTYISTNGTNMSFSYKNGEMASLADVSQLGETVNKLGENVSLNTTSISSLENRAGTNSSSSFQAPSHYTEEQALNEVANWIQLFGSNESGVMGWMWKGHDYMISTYAYVYEYTSKYLLVVTKSSGGNEFIKKYTV